MLLTLFIEDGTAKLGITGPLGTYLNLGTVNEFKDGKVPETLELDHVNQYKLKPLANGKGLVCDIFWDPKATVKTEVKTEVVLATGVSLIALFMWLDINCLVLES